MENKFCDLSPRALIQDVENDIIAFVPVVRSSWGSDTITLLLEPDDPTDAPFLSTFVGTSENRVIASYQHELAVATVAGATHTTEKGKSQWELRLNQESTEFSPSIEMGFSGTSADELAEARARRLLLNENPWKESSDINQIARELFVRGMETAVRVERSPFPAIYQHYGSDPQRFLEIAWILAVTQLKLSGAVAQVEKLRLTLAAGALEVDFVGRRRKQYVNAPAYVIRVQGFCPLAS
ncbi:MAG TPA: hypothetical protein VEO19_17075 [Terriglobia bacterium]|nr:hypothetical protein [Terriglobia bacterium]